LGIYCKAGIEHRIEWKKPQMSSTTMALQIRARFWTLPKGYFTQIAELRNEGNQANIRSRKHGGKTHPPLYFRPPQPLTPPSSQTPSSDGRATFRYQKTQMQSGAGNNG
jgi:hypothetical protein